LGLHQWLQKNMQNKIVCLLQWEAHLTLLKDAKKQIKMLWAKQQAASICEARKAKTRVIFWDQLRNKMGLKLWSSKSCNVFRHKRINFVKKFIRMLLTSLILLQACTSVVFLRFKINSVKTSERPSDSISTKTKVQIKALKNNKMPRYINNTITLTQCI
jgi:hypothetical protein